jgi:hypothetical protein
MVPVITTSDLWLFLRPMLGPCPSEWNEWHPYGSRNGDGHGDGTGLDYGDGWGNGEGDGTGYGHSHGDNDGNGYGDGGFNF